MSNLVIGIYFHPEAYPPTLNAVGELSECFDLITIVHRPHRKGSWRYPPNVETVSSGTFISSVNQEKASLLKKAIFFFQFTVSFFKACRKSSPSFILVYDSLSLLAYSLVKPFIRNHKVWYHNHDVTEPDSIRKYSISWFAWKQERKAFKSLDIFSLPADERKSYFPLNSFKGMYFFIPNYPAKQFYAPFYKPKQLSQPVKLIFQGSISPHHGIEEIIPLLSEDILGYNLELVLMGPCKDEYMKLLTELASLHHVTNKLNYIGVMPYANVPEVGASCHIGIGIFAGKDIMNSTLGTASNKLYEYAAVGLPLIYNNRPHLTRYLYKYDWAFPSELTGESIKENITLIIKSYNQLSSTAYQDFIGELNFEKGFMPVKTYIRKNLVHS